MPNTTEKVERKVVLSVDDDVVNRLIIEENLKNHFDIRSAENGDQALEILGNEKIDLALLDVMMPGISGHDICKEMRKNDALSDIPVIFVTAKGRPEDIKEGLEIGGNDYIIKPFHPTELLARVNAQLKAAEFHSLQAELEKAKTVKAMIASLNHEIRNPLSIISGNLRPLRDDEDQIKCKSIKSINDAVTRIVAILDKISNIETVETEKYIGNSETELISL